MADANVEPTQVSQNDSNHNNAALSKSAAEEISSAKTATESSNESKDLNITTNTSTDGKVQRTKRDKTEYFRQRMREKRKLAKERFRQQNTNGTARGFLRTQSTTVQRKQTKFSLGRDILSCKLTEEEKKMLEFYKVRLSTLRRENEQLHKTLTDLVSENVRLLQSGPA